MLADVLVLTHAYTPHRVVTWRAAVTMLCLDKVDVVETAETTIASGSARMAAPAVVRLKRPVPMCLRGPKLSRANVLRRDGFACQYCGARGTVRELTLDHVIPRAKGGKTTWENLVAACRPCNARKADRAPEEVGLALRSRPVRPRSVALALAPRA